MWAWSAPLIQPRFRRPCRFYRCFLNELVVVCSTVWIRKLLWRKHFAYINVATFQKCFHFRKLFTLKGFEFWQLKIQLLLRFIFICFKNQVKNFHFGWLTKVENILKGSLDSIPSPSTSVKIQIMGGKVCLRCKSKTLLDIFNKLLKTKSLLTSLTNVLPYYLK